jgi:hypothetical protein
VCSMRRFLVCELCEGKGPPPSAGQGRHLPGKDRTAHPSHPELERAANAVVAENGR